MTSCNRFGYGKPYCRGWTQENNKILMRQFSGEGVVLFTGATGSLRGSALFQNSSMAKSAVRMLSQSMARELGPKGVHVAHVVIDGGIDRGGHGSASADADPKFQPDDIAEAYFQLFAQKRSAWTQELDLRHWKERF